MVGVKAVVLSGAVALGASVSGAVAQNVPNYSLSCISLSELNTGYPPPKLARSVRDCVAQGRFDDAMQVFLAYSSYGMFDQQRVRDESGQAVLGELNLWIFSGYSIDVMDQLRSSVGRLRQRDGALFLQACAALAKAGPPSYRPDYMIERAMMPRRSDEDWHVEGFSVAVAWEKSLVEINGCPSV